MADQATADLRTVQADGTTWVALDDIAAFLLDAATTLDAHPEMSAPDVLRRISSGLATRNGT